jgi:hypothetical protein
MFNSRVPNRQIKDAIQYGQRKMKVLMSNQLPMKSHLLKYISLAAIIFVTGCKPALTQKTAEKLIPDGMSESKVYDILGTNAVVSIGNNQKYLLYFFPFFPPPQVDTKIDSIEVVISNDVVVDRQFPSK